MLKLRLRCSTAFSWRVRCLRPRFTREPLEILSEGPQGDLEALGGQHFDDLLVGEPLGLELLDVRVQAPDGVVRAG